VRAKHYYRREEKEERDWECEENRELRCHRDRGHGACSVQLTVVPPPQLFRSPNPFSSFNDTVR